MTMTTMKSDCKSILFPLVWLLVTFLFSLSVSPVRADMGPKPEMTFEFVTETAVPVTIVSGQQWQCETAACADAYRLEEAGPQGFRCTAAGCTSMAYGYTDYNRLVIEFSDGVTRESNVFETRSFHNRYRVTVREADLLVERTGGSGNPANWLLGGLLVLICSVALLIGGAVVWVIILLRRRQAPAG